MTKIVWNGCDNYIDADEAMRRGYDFDGEKLYHGAHEFEAFEVVEIDLESLSRDDDDEPIMDGIYGTETGRFFRAH